MIKGWGVTTRNVRASIAYHSRVAIQAERYYREQQDHVLGEDQEVGESPTLLHSSDEVLAALGLQQGEVDIRVVTALAAGFSPSTGEVLVHGRRGIDPNTGEPWARRCYYDFALSVPQSYSTAFAAALTAGDTATADAMRHDLVGAAVASYRAMEDIVTLGRRDAGGATKVTAHAPFLANLHSTSRPVSGRTHGDPTLHVHLRVMNMALGADGRWSAVDYQPLWSAVRTWSALFEADLQARILARGGQTTVVQRGSRKPWASWELAGHNPALDAAFSTRHTVVDALEARLWQRNAGELLARIQADDVAAGEQPRQMLTGQQWQAMRPTAKQIDAEVRRTREKKAPTTRAQLLEEWQQRVAEHGYRHTPDDGIDRRFGINPRLPARVRDLLRARARDAAVETIATRLLAPSGLTASCAVWARPQLGEAVTRQLVEAQLGVDDAREVMRRVESRAVRAPVPPAGHTVWTTAELLANEREWAAYLTELAGDADRLHVQPDHIDAAIAAEATRVRERGHGGGLDHEQLAAVRASLSGPGFSAVVGDAGSGKTTTARVVVDALRRAGYSPIGLAMAGSASQVLSDSARLPCWNVRDFLTRVEYGALRHDLGRRTVAVLDEAGTVDDRTLAELTRVLRGAGVAALIALGDDHQAQPIGPGAPLSWLRRNLPDRVSRLTINYRQGEHVGDPRADRSSLLRYGDARAYLEALDYSGCLIVTRTTDDAVAELSSRWAAAVAGGGDVRDHVGVCNLNDSRARLNEAFRAAYAGMGRLGEQAILPGGRPLAIGDRVAFNAPFRELVLDHRGDSVPRRREPRAVAPADYRTTGQRALNRARATVVGFDPTRRIIGVATDGTADQPGQTLLLRADDAAQVLDYSYCVTTNIAQGATAAGTYALGDVSQITGAATAYVQSTRETRDHWLAISAESAGVGPLTAEWRSATVAALAAAMSRQRPALCALDYFGAPSVADATTDAAHQEQRRRGRVLEVLMSPATDELLAHLAPRGLPPEQGRNWTTVQALSVAEDLAGAPQGSTLRGWLAAIHGDERARRWTNDALLAAGFAPSTRNGAGHSIPARDATPIDATLAALRMPATTSQMESLVRAGISTGDPARWTWCRASVRLDLASGRRAPGMDVVDLLCAQGATLARAAAAVNRVLRDYDLRLEVVGPTTHARRIATRLQAVTDEDDEHLRRIAALLRAPEGSRRLDAVHDYMAWRRASERPATVGSGQSTLHAAGGVGTVALATSELRSARLVLQESAIGGTHPRLAITPAPPRGEAITKRCGMVGSVSPVPWASRQRVR